MRFHILAKDYVEGMWRILQQSEPEDFVLATGETHPVREYVEKAFAVVGISIKYAKLSIKATVAANRDMCRRWRNSGVEEEGYDTKTNKVLVKVDTQYFRPAEVEYVSSRFLVSFGFADVCSNTAFSSETLQKRSACLAGHAKLPLTNSSTRWSRLISKLPEVSLRIKTKCPSQTCHSEEM